jgi:hypothetical protein
MEINPSSKRTGSKILELFGEATQSHQIDIGKNDLDLDTIILFEEIDNIFEDEIGFFKTLMTLMQNTKRPIILTCNGIVLFVLFY